MEIIKTTWNKGNFGTSFVGRLQLMPSPFTTLRRKFSVWESFFSLICWHKSIIFWLKLLIGEKIFRLGKIYLLLKILPFLISFPNFVYLSCVIVYKMLFTRWLFTGLTNGRCKCFYDGELPLPTCDDGVSSSVEVMVATMNVWDIILFRNGVTWENRSHFLF